MVLPVMPRLRGRGVQVQAQPDGMALVTAMVSAETGQLLDGFLDAAADAARDLAEQDGEPDGRTHDQRRADVLAMLIQALSEGVHIPLVPDPRNEACDEEPTDETGSPFARQPSHEPSHEAGPEGDREQTHDQEQSQEWEQESGQEAASDPADEREQDRRTGKATCSVAESPPSEAVPEAFRRRLEEDLQATTTERHRAIKALGFSPVPEA